MNEDWADFKGNCRYRHVIRSVDTCLYDSGTPDDCPEDIDTSGYCPRKSFMYTEEGPLSQCDKCGSEVAPEDIDWDMRYSVQHIYRAVAYGILIGIAMMVVSYITFT